MRGSNFLTHGQSKTPTYRSWCNMKERCHNTKNSEYKNYGSRGITVCKRWLKFENFLEDMGLCPRGLTLDRINNDGNYEPSNCRWTTRKEQSYNRRTNRLITYKGETHCLLTWAKKTGVGWSTLRRRICELDWSIEKALTTPTRKALSITFSGETKTLAEWARTLRTEDNTLYRRFYRGWSVEKTLTTPAGRSLI